jgi:hypothetical protein
MNANKFVNFFMLTGPFKQSGLGGVANIETAVKNIYYDLYGGKPLSTN